MAAAPQLPDLRQSRPPAWMPADVGDQMQFNRLERLRLFVLPGSGTAWRLAMIAAVMALLAATSAASAQDWPTRPMTLVVPLAAGGSSDAIARIVAEGLRAELGQPVLVENVSGAGGMLGSSQVAKARPDGYQFVLGNVGTHAQNQSVYRKPLYNAASDFAPVGLVVDQTLLLLARKDFPADDLRGFITYAKANQDRLQFGSAGVGGSNHLGCLLLNTAIGIEVTHVPYRSGAQALQDMLAGRIDKVAAWMPATERLVEQPLFAARGIVQVMLRHAGSRCSDRRPGASWKHLDYPVTPGAVTVRRHKARSRCAAP